MKCGPCREAVSPLEKVDKAVENPKRSLELVADGSIDFDYLKRQKESIDKVDRLIEEAEQSLIALKQEFYKTAMQDDLEEKSSSPKKSSSAHPKQNGSEILKQTANKRLYGSRKTQSKETVLDEEKTLNRRRSKEVVGHQERIPGKKFTDKVKSKEEQEDGERSKNKEVVSNRLKVKPKERKSSATFTSNLHKQLANKNKLTRSGDDIITPSEDAEDEKQSEQVKPENDVTPCNSETVSTVKNNKLVRLQNDVEYKDDDDEVIFEDDYTIRKESVPVNLRRFIGVKNSLFLKMPLSSDFSLTDYPEEESKDDIKGSIRALGKLVALANKVSVIPTSGRPVKTSDTGPDALDASNSDEIRSEDYSERNEPRRSTSGSVDRLQKIACVPVVDASGKTANICKIDKASSELPDKPDSYVCCKCREEGLTSESAKEACSKYPEKTCICRQALKNVEDAAGCKKRSSLLKTSDRRSSIPKRTSFCVECQTPPPPSVENLHEERVKQSQQEEQVMQNEQEEQVIQNQQEEQVMQNQQEETAQPVKRQELLPFVDSEKAIPDVDTDDSYLNTISERTEITSDVSSSIDPVMAQEKQKQLSVQHLPQISIKPPLVLQKVFEIDIKPTGSVNMQIPVIQNVRYEEILHAESSVDNCDVKSRPSDLEIEKEATNMKEVKTDGPVKIVKSNVSFKNVPVVGSDILKTRSFNEKPRSNNVGSTSNADVSDFRMSSNVLVANKSKEGNMETTTERKSDLIDFENNDDDFDEVPSDKETDEPSVSLSFAHEISDICTTVSKNSLKNFLPEFIISEVMKREEQQLNENVTQSEPTKNDTDLELFEEKQSNLSNQPEENLPEESQRKEDKLEGNQSEGNQPSEHNLKENLFQEDLTEGYPLEDEKSEMDDEVEDTQKDEEPAEEEIAEIDPQEADVDIEDQAKDDFLLFEIHENKDNDEISTKQEEEEEKEEEEEDDQVSKQSTVNRSPGGTPLFTKDVDYRSGNNMPVSISTYFREEDETSFTNDEVANKSDMMTEILSKLSEAGGLKAKICEYKEEDEDGNTSLKLVHVVQKGKPNTEKMVQDTLSELDKALKNLEDKPEQNVTVINCDCICKNVQEQPKQKDVSKCSILKGAKPCHSATPSTDAGYFPCLLTGGKPSDFTSAPTSARSSHSSSAPMCARTSNAPSAPTSARSSNFPSAPTSARSSNFPSAPTYARSSNSPSAPTSARPSHSASARLSNISSAKSNNTPPAKLSYSPPAKPSYSASASTAAKPSVSIPKTPLKSAQKVPSRPVKKRSTKSSENFRKSSDSSPKSNSTAPKNVSKSTVAYKRISIITDKKCATCPMTKTPEVIENIPPVMESSNSLQLPLNKPYVVGKAPSIIKKLSANNQDKDGYSDPNVKSSLMSNPRPLDPSKCFSDESRARSPASAKRTTSFHSTTKSPNLSESEESVYVLTHDVSVQVSDESILPGKKASVTVSKPDKKSMRVGMSDEIDSKMKKKQKVNSKDQKQQIPSCAENKCCTCDVSKNVVLQPVTIHYETKGVQKSLEDWAYKPVKLHKTTNCKELDSSSLNETDLENLPCRNAPCGDISTCPEFISNYHHREDTTSSTQSSNRKNGKYYTASSSSSDVIEAKVEESLSEGEIKCKCSVSIGELHLCRLANSIKARTAYLKRHPDRLLKQEFPGENFHLLRQQTFYDNWVAYYASRGSGTSESESNEILKDP